MNKEDNKTSEKIRSLPASQRREEILTLLSQSKGRTLSASSIASHFHVSRQIIVGDIALLRAGGADIVSTARGYLLQETGKGIIRVITCCHDEATLCDELYIVVDNGGAVLDISVEHPVYGVISAPLRIFSRYDADELANSLAVHHAAPLLTLGGGVHSHTISCPDESSCKRICEQLKEKGILVE